MKASIQLRQNQQLAMTPQLQQAIRFLQLSTIELQQEVQRAIETNPLLEIEDEFCDHQVNDAINNNTLSNAMPLPVEDTLITSKTESPSNEHTEDSFQSDSEWEGTIAQEPSSDSHWEDTYQVNASEHVSHSPSSSDFAIEQHSVSIENLSDHLEWQLNLTTMSDIDHFIAKHIIDAIDERGYLSHPPEEIMQSVHSQLTSAGIDYPLQKEEVMAVIHRIQQFEPAGVGAIDLADCLTIQLKQLAEDTPYLSAAKVLVSEHLALLATRDFSALRQRMQIKEKPLAFIIELITSLHPEPGAQFSQHNTDYVIPDVSVEKHQNQWRVKLNEQATPKIRLNQHYAQLSQSLNGQDRQFIKDNLQEAKWFLKSLENRHSTLLKVASRICAIQQAFLEQGEEAMQPLILSEIADDLEMHESTISRVTTQKYIHTPRGLFELKYFFSSHVQTNSGGEASSTAIRAIIKKLIANEVTRKPLSDSKLTQLLEEQGIQVARRTVAKYREKMNIPPSNERKSLA